MESSTRKDAKRASEGDGTFDLAPPVPVLRPSRMHFFCGFPISEAACQTVINRDVPCGYCGYNLRGLRRAGRCPECGHEIPMSSFRDDRLELCNDSWGKTICLGVWILLLGLISNACILIKAALGDQQYLMLAIPAVSVTAIGIWLITSREAAEIEPMHPIWPIRVIARRSLLASAVLVLSVAGLTVLATQDPIWWIMVWVLSAFMLLCLSATAFTTGFYLQDIARRVPNDSLSQHFLNLTWGIGGSLLLAGISIVLSLVLKDWILFLTGMVLIASIPVYFLGVVAVLRLGWDLLLVVRTYRNRPFD